MLGSHVSGILVVYVVSTSARWTNRDTKMKKSQVTWKEVPSSESATVYLAAQWGETNQMALLIVYHLSLITVKNKTRAEKLGTFYPLGQGRSIESYLI